MPSNCSWWTAILASVVVGAVTFYAVLWITDLFETGIDYKYWIYRGTRWAAGVWLTFFPSVPPSAPLQNGPPKASVKIDFNSPDASAAGCVTYDENTGHVLHRAPPPTHMKCSYRFAKVEIRALDTTDGKARKFPVDLENPADVYWEGNQLNWDFVLWLGKTQQMDLLADKVQKITLTTDDLEKIELTDMNRVVLTADSYRVEDKTKTSLELCAE